MELHRAWKLSTVQKKANVTDGKLPDKILQQQRRGQEPRRHHGQPWNSTECGNFNGPAKSERHRWEIAG
jgi:hypothetical protein